MPEDISREGLTGEKVAQLGRLFVPNLNHAIAKVSKFSVIDIAKINELLGTNFKGVILDIDECVAPHHGEVLQENVEAIIEMINQGINVVIFSNMKSSERYVPLIDSVRAATGAEIKIITSPYAKPDPRGFKEALKELDLQNGEDALMIGDNFVTDGGSINAGIPFIKVDPIKTAGESALKVIKRSFQTGSRSFYSAVSAFYDFIGDRKVLRDEDFQAS